MKIVFIGAGSFRFSLQLFRNFAALGQVIPFELWLVDINEPLLLTMVEIQKKILDKAKSSDKVQLHYTTISRDALENADVVIVSISIGQQKSEWYDIHLPLKFGIPQSVGDTCGPGGIFRALRVVPVINAIANEMDELCPGATMLNYTNPMAAIVLGADQVSKNIEILGVCHELMGAMPSIHKFLRKTSLKVSSWEDFELQYIGINHFAWIISILYEGMDLYPLLRERSKLNTKMSNHLFNFRLLNDTSYYPYPGGRHLVEFLPSYYNYFNYKAVWNKFNQRFLIKRLDLLTQILGIPTLRNVGLLEKERKVVLRIFKLLSKGVIPTPGPSWKGEKVVEMIADKFYIELPNTSNREDRAYPVNLMNTNGKISSLFPNSCVLETQGCFQEGHFKPEGAKRIPQKIVDMVTPHTLNTKKYVQAATSGDPERLLDALLSEPSVQFLNDKDLTENLMWNMLYYESEWLPAFKEVIPNDNDFSRLVYQVTRKELTPRNSKSVKWPPQRTLRKSSYFY